MENRKISIIAAEPANRLGPQVDYEFSGVDPAHH
jgi:hypothetical protein